MAIVTFSYCDKLIYISSLWCICHIQRYIPINDPPGSSCVQWGCVIFRFICGGIVSVRRCLCVLCVFGYMCVVYSVCMCWVHWKTANLRVIHWKWSISCWQMELYRHRAHLEPVMQLPDSSRYHFCREFDPRDHCCAAIFALCHSTCQHPSYHHTPWGLLCWQSDWMTITATSEYCVQYTWYSSMANCHGTQQLLTQGCRV